MKLGVPGILKDIEVHFRDLEWNKWQSMMTQDQSVAERVIQSIVSKSRKDCRRFNLSYGMGKNSNSVKLLATTEEERNIWVLAIQLMLVYQLKMDFLQVHF